MNEQSETKSEAINGKSKEQVEEEKREKMQWVFFNSQFLIYFNFSSFF